MLNYSLEYIKKIKEKRKLKEKNKKKEKNNP
jgi:hypothetical protein